MSPTSPRVRRNRRRLLFAVSALVTVAVVGTVAFVAIDLAGAANGIHHSDAVLPTAAAGVPQDEGEQNILIMGLDSRVDEDGKPYPQEIYDAIHAEDASVGGYNTNVLMYVHIPAGGGQAVALSIPRDDDVDYAGAPGGARKGKIKEAYGRAFAAKDDELRAAGVSEDDAYQQARDAARAEEMQTVSQFLGGVPIDHFVEVTMAAFYRVAQAVQPLDVCLNHATADTFSGADFAAGPQQIDAAQAMAFVRQRRDTKYDNVFLTDLDRTRRQQAFLVSLALKLRDAQTFTDFGRMQDLLDTAKQYVAVDKGFDLLSLASTAQRLAGGDVTFQTLPIERFGTVDGESVNIVDQKAIAAQVSALLHPAPAAAPDPNGTSAPDSASGAPSAAPSPTSAVYTDSEQPLRAGAVPCVN
ncbi:LytR family transcriptional regulator [Microbacterium testaceum]|uniref:LytR family transcriptional regulator n=1 Tax=Microbacterium testaceum TaxID=2033 RepID=A0A147F243_MICTE|nr:LCP family protein [Microbacterium testaceum]KTR96690.1 LytR family transcriptional regulator [Microbacterium testaceum]